MTGSNTGSAREVAPGRLSNFEDSDESTDQGGSAAPLLPPRRPRATRAEPSPSKTAAPRRPSAAAQKKPAPAVEAPEQPATVPTPGQALQARQKAGKGPEDRVRPSNVHIPVALLERIEAKCKAEGLSHGEVIIVAIETTYARLKDLIHPAATAGGNLFAVRRSRASRSADGPLTPLNYRLREADFTTLDQLVENFGASSRGHLITAALNDYFRL